MCAAEQKNDGNTGAPLLEGVAGESFDKCQEETEEWHAMTETKQPRAV